jgi:hypothetical protein
VSGAIAPADIVADLWRLVGADAKALDYLRLSGSDPALPSSFRIGAAAQASIAAVGLAAAELRHRAGAPRQHVSVDMRHAATEFRSEHYLTIDGKAPAAFADPLFGAYRTGGGHFVRLHMNFPHHRENVLKFLGCAPTRAAIEEALKNWEAVAFETEAYRHSCVVAAMRSPDEWAKHPQAGAIASAPVVQIENIGVAPARPLPQGPKSLSGLRVLDITRIIAGPVAGRALAAHGADVMRIAAPGLPFIDWLVKDTGRGKLSAYADIATADGRAALARLIGDADIFLQAFRPGALAARGFGAADVVALRPGIVYGSLSAYGDRDRGRRAAASILWCRPRPVSMSQKRRPPAYRARRSCPAKRSITRPVICLRSARSWRAFARRAKAAAGSCASRWPLPDTGCGISAALRTASHAGFPRATTWPTCLKMRHRRSV